MGGEAPDGKEAKPLTSAITGAPSTSERRRPARSLAGTPMMDIFRPADRPRGHLRPSPTARRVTPRDDLAAGPATNVPICSSLNGIQMRRRARTAGGKSFQNIELFTMTMTGLCPRVSPANNVSVPAWDRGIRRCSHAAREPRKTRRDPFSLRRRN